MDIAQRSYIIHFLYDMALSFDNEHCASLIKLLLFLLFSGLSGGADDLANRVEVFSSNVIPPKPPKTFLQVRKYSVYRGPLMAGRV